MAASLNCRCRPRLPLGQYAQKYRSQIEFFEQPMSVGEEFQMRELSAKYSIPIALDESLNGPSGKQWLDQDNWQGLFVIKPSAFGSIDILKNSFSKLGTRCILSSYIGFDRESAKAPKQQCSVGKGLLNGEVTPVSSRPNQVEPEQHLVACTGNCTKF